MSARTMRALGFVSFLAVYREVFETVLFYEALAAEAGPGSTLVLLGGLAAAAATLLVLGWAIVRGSLRMPLGAVLRRLRRAHRPPRRRLRGQGYRRAPGSRLSAPPPGEYSRGAAHRASIPARRVSSSRPSSSSVVAVGFAWTSRSAAPSGHFDARGRVWQDRRRQTGPLGPEPRPRTGSRVNARTGAIHAQVPRHQAGRPHRHHA